MQRPNQKRFESFAVHFEWMDAALLEFASMNRFELDRNVNRQPGRVLRRRGNPHFLIDIGLEQNWLENDFRVDIPLAIMAVAYYEPESPTENHLIYRIDKLLAQRETFSTLASRLNGYLYEGLSVINGWTPNIIKREGKAQENIRKKFATGSLGDS